MQFLVGMTTVLLNVVAMLLAIALFYSVVWSKFRGLLNSEGRYFSLTDYSVVTLFGPLVTFAFLSGFLPVLDELLRLVGLDIVGGSGRATLGDWIGNRAEAPATLMMISSIPFGLLLLYVVGYQLAGWVNGRGEEFKPWYPIVAVGFTPVVGILLAIASQELGDPAISFAAPTTISDIGFSHVELAIGVFLSFIPGVLVVVALNALMFFPMAMGYPVWVKEGYWEPNVVSVCVGGAVIYGLFKLAVEVLLPELILPF